MAHHRSKWRSPSNIALVKYWGKYPNQMPANPSISFSLSACHTETEIILSDKKAAEAFSFDVLLAGELQEDFKPKIEQFFGRIVRDAPWLKDYHLEINTHNSFPHSSGIASSASGMSALSLCLLDLQQQLLGAMEEDFKKSASIWSRLGSGSASRSVYGGLVEWGRFAGLPASADEYAIPYQGSVDAVFRDYCDFILLVETGSKAVSSTAGHGLMKHHPFAERRFLQAHENLNQLLSILEKGDLDAFGELVESEALTLHAMMMSSRPYFILMKPNTLKIIELIWTYRNTTSLPVCFTLDAGANIHLLFPAEFKSQITSFVDTELTAYLKDGRYIADEVGTGPQKLSGNQS